MGAARHEVGDRLGHLHLRGEKRFSRGVQVGWREQFAEVGVQLDPAEDLAELGSVATDQVRARILGQAEAASFVRGNGDHGAQLLPSWRATQRCHTGQAALPGLDAEVARQAFDDEVAELLCH